MTTVFAALCILLIVGPHFGDAAKPSPPPRSPPRPPSPRRPPSPPPNLRLKNGIRLTGGSGPRGRLEVSSATAWFSAPGGKVGWSPVCDSPDFTDGVAETMCVMLGYKYGRKYFTPETAYLNTTNTSNTITEPPYSVGRIYCDPNGGPSRRLLRNSAALLGDGDHRTAAAAGDRSVADRSLFSMPRRTIPSSRTAPYTCYFYMGGPCGPTGPLAGVECSHTLMSPAPPPPPGPPRPPPGVSASIVMVGGLGVNMNPRESKTEPNLCAASDLCPMYSRFDLQVDSPDGSGAKIWAPLCAPEDPELAEAVGGIACGQVYDWPTSLDGGVEVVLSKTSETHFAIPEGPSANSSDDFDPTTVPAWVTVTVPAAFEGPVTRVQDFDLQVSTQPCLSGAMLAVSCQAWGESRRRQ